MNKTELVNSIASKSGLNKKNSEAALNALVSSIEETLQKGEKIVLVGFGTFEVRDRAARKGRNPQTKEEITIPASRAPVFKAGKGLKDIINK
ncbi:UNVERIFIED_CONTAM: DNA-binding protein HU-beta [Acetivibrio alkalicellulosi]